MDKLTIRDCRCCMCPNGDKPSKKVCPGIKRTRHPEETPCDFVVSYRDDKGCFISVSRGLGRSYMTMRQKTLNAGMHRVKTKFLPLRKSFDDAQEDLNAYAASKGWKPVPEDE